MSKTPVVQGQHGKLPLTSDINKITVAVEAGFTWDAANKFYGDKAALFALIDTIVHATREAEGVRNV